MRNCCWCYEVKYLKKRMYFRSYFREYSYMSILQAAWLKWCKGNKSHFPFCFNAPNRLLGSNVVCNTILGLIDFIRDRCFCATPPPPPPPPPPLPLLVSVWDNLSVTGNMSRPNPYNETSSGEKRREEERSPFVQN